MKLYLERALLPCFLLALGACVEPPSNVPPTQEMGGSIDQGSDLGHMLDASGDLREDEGDQGPRCPDSCTSGCSEAGVCDRECDIDTDCDDEDLGGSVCDPQTFTCVECLVTQSEVPTRGCQDSSRPVCDENNSCVACSEELGGPLYSATLNACVSCLEDGDCNDPSSPWCDTSTGTCQGCERAPDPAQRDAACASLGVDTETICDLAQGCVECVDSSQCTEASAPTCQTDNTCGACVDNVSGESSDCASATLGALTQCVQQNCVECQDNTHCMGKGAMGQDAICTEQYTCATDAIVQSREVGQSCTYDDECQTGAACVQVTFGPSQLPLGGYCMTEKSGSCNSPWGFTRQKASQANATMREFCLHKEDKVSPEAVYNTIPEAKSCASSDDCGQGSECLDVVGANTQCTYSCAISAECPTDCENGYCY